MSLFIDTTGRSTLTIAVCSRCRKKFPTGELRPDPNAPGLLVCKDDVDQFDPWRLPAREADKIAVTNARPDGSIAINAGTSVDSQGTIQSAPLPANRSIYPSST